MFTRRDFLKVSAAGSFLPWNLQGGESAPSLEETLSGIIDTYLKAGSIPGGQLALAKGGKLLFSKGFGMADRDKNVATTPRTLFRIASVSKPLTAAAILVLAEEGKLSLDAKMLEVLKVDIFLPEGKKVDPRLKDITLRHLLQHTGGWDRGKSGDMMFESKKIAKILGIASPPGPKDVIREVLARPLDTDPGTHYAYSNFGYCVLGRIIEQISGQPYEKFVQERVLKPAGINGPKQGASLTQAEGEARYYTPGKEDESPVFPNLPDKVPSPYGGWCLETMDSHGGWIAAAEDIVRFAASLDDIGGTSPFKKKETWETLITPPAGEVGHDKEGKVRPVSYGCGFNVHRSEKGAAIEHSGSLPGTTTFVWKRADGYTWAAFFNMRHDGRGSKDASVVAQLNKALDEAGAAK
jgi:N-acyl-D-amino-acid deacylase